MSQQKRLKDPDQIRSFKAMAGELGCLETEAAFDAKLEKVARAALPRKPVARTKSPKPDKLTDTTNKQTPQKKKVRFILPGA